MNDIEQTTDFEEIPNTESPRRSKAGRGFPVLHVRFAPELHGRLKRRAVEGGMSMQDLIRDAVIDYLDGSIDVPLKPIAK